jgi:hypothetical protein
MKKIFLNITFLSISLFACGSGMTNASEVTPCIAANKAAINEFVPGQDKRRITNKSKPLETRKYSGQDDGGVYTATLLKYKNYEIQIVRELIDSVSTSSPDVIWAENIKIGDTRSIIDKRIGYAKVSNSKDEAQYLICSDVGDVYAILHFVSNILTRIQLVIDRP